MSGSIRAGFLKGLLSKLITAADEPTRDITVAEASLHIAAGDLFDWLNSRSPRIDFSGYVGDVGRELCEGLDRHRTNFPASKAGVQRSGLLYLAVLANELIGELLPAQV
jgi:hypothetical protein